MPALIAVMTFLTVAAFTAYAVSKATENERLIAERLVRFRERVVTQRRVEVETNLLTRVVRPLLDRAAKISSQVTPAARKEAIRKRLMQAGNPWGLQPTEYIGAKYLLTLGLPALFFLLGPGRPGDGRSFGSAFFLLLIAGVFGSLLPDLILRRRITSRQAAIAKGLPDVLDLLTVSVEAGLGFDASMAKVVEKHEGAIGEEFRRVLQEMRMGKPRREALRDLGTRSEVPDLMSFTVALVQADQLGVSMGRVLRVQSEEMRRRRRQRAEEAAMKAPVKMLFPLVMFIFPTLFIVLLGPAAIQAYQAFVGN